MSSYFGGPPPYRKRNPTPKVSQTRYYLNGTGRDLMSLYPAPKIMPFTAKVYHAIPPDRNKSPRKTYGFDRPKPSGSGRDSFIWQQSNNGNPSKPSFRPTTTPWAKASLAPWANDREVTRSTQQVKRKSFNSNSAKARRERLRSVQQKQYMQLLSYSPRSPRVPESGTGTIYRKDPPMMDRPQTSSIGRRHVSTQSGGIARPSSTGNPHKRWL